MEVRESVLKRSLDRIFRVLLIAKNPKGTPIDSRSMTLVEFLESARASRLCFCDQEAFVVSGRLGQAAARAFRTSYCWLLKTHYVLASFLMPRVPFCRFRS